MLSVSNGSGEPASGPVLNRKTGSVRFQTRRRIRPADSWQAPLQPAPMNPQVLPGLAWPVGSILRFLLSGFTLMVPFGYATVDRRMLTTVSHSPFLMYSLPHDQNKEAPMPYHILKMSVNRASMIVGHVSWVIWGCSRLTTVINKVYCKKSKWNAPNPILKKSVNGASTILGPASLAIWVALDHKHP